MTKKQILLAVSFLTALRLLDYLRVYDKECWQRAWASALYANCWCVGYEEFEHWEREPDA